MTELRIMIVDDSIVYLRYLEDLLKEIPNVVIVGKANDGAKALEMIPQLMPDLITLDVEMPILNGVECLRQIRQRWPDILAIMVSSHTAYGASVTMECLSLGAFDFLAKPDLSDANETMSYLRRQLRTKISMVKVVHNANRIVAKENQRIQRSTKPSAATATPENTPVQTAPKPAFKTRIGCVGIGISTGGPEALRSMIPLLPATLRVPILIVQHMPSLFTKALAESLDKRSALCVQEATDGEQIKPGHIYIAPGEKHMRVEREGDHGPVTIRITQDPPENHCRPSVDYLFRSLSQVYGPATLAIVMTGMGSDGARGVRLVSRRGGLIAAQDKETSTIFGMPMEAIKTGLVQDILPLPGIADYIVNTTNYRRN